MAWLSKGLTPPEHSEVVVFDDGGSGLFDACVARFTGFGWTVVCDSRHAVWVKNADNSYAVGLAPWLLEQQSLAEILDGVETKMKRAVAKLKA